MNSLSQSSKAFRIGLFIDGYTLRKVNDYYLNFHSVRSRIHLAGLQNFILHQVRKSCPTDRSIVFEGHYYHMYTENKNGDKLGKFEKCLRDCGLQVHYPAAYFDFTKCGNSDLINDLSMFSLFQEIDVAVLVTTQGFYANAVKMLKSRKIPFLLLGWDLCYKKNENTVHWRTDSILKGYADKYYAMEQIMADPFKKSFIRNLFVKQHHIKQQIHKKDEAVLSIN